MPWNTIEELPDSVKKGLKTSQQQIFLSAFNSAFTGTCKDKKDREACAMKIAWSAANKTQSTSLHSEPMPFIVASVQSPTLITGPLIEVDKKNLNGWGIPKTEAEAVKAGLLGVPLKKCSGAGAIFNEHSCDYDWNPDDQIGQIVSAHEHDGWIHATAKVTDPIAENKIRSGTWPARWSIFGGYKSEDETQMRFGTIPRSVTLVDNPAYPGAKFQAASQSPIDKEHGNMTGEQEPKTYTKEELDQEVAKAMEAQNATMTQAHEEAIAGMTQQHAAALEAKDQEIKTLQASAKQAPEMMPRAEAEKLIAAATEQATANTMDLLKKQQLSDEIVTMQASYNMIKPEDAAKVTTDLMKKSSAALEQDLDLLKNVGLALESAGTSAVDKFKAANLPGGSGRTDDREFTVGSPKQWGK